MFHYLARKDDPSCVLSYGYSDFTTLDGKPNYDTNTYKLFGPFNDQSALPNPFTIDNAARSIDEQFEHAVRDEQPEVRAGYYAIKHAIGQALGSNDFEAVNAIISGETINSILKTKLKRILEDNDTK